MTSTWHRVARTALVVTCVAGPTSAKADDRPGPVRHGYEITASDRAKVYAAVRRRLEAGRARDARGSSGFTAHWSASEIPAFARKYGMKCSACHIAVPVLNSYGQNFKDNGYRMKVGTDDLRANEPAYWPLFAWLWKGYEFDAERIDGQTVQRRGGITNGALAFGGLGSISDKLSFRYVPIIYEDGLTFLDHGWIRYNQAFGSDWLNVKVGNTDLDLPISAGRDYNMGNARFALLYAYRVPGSVSGFTFLGAQPGIELMGHDRGSRNRYALSVFNAPGAPRAHCTFCSPGVYGRVTRRFELAEGFLRDVQVGAFGSYSTWPVGADTSDLKGQSRFGGEVEFLLGSDVLPLRVTAVGMTGWDDRALVPQATSDPTFNAGLLQLEYVPSLPLAFYGRLQVIRNDRQGVAGRPDDFGDQDFQLLGAHYLFEVNSRYGALLELTYSRQKFKRTGPQGEDVTDQILYLGAHLIF